MSGHKVVAKKRRIRYLSSSEEDESQEAHPTTVGINSVQSASTLASNSSEISELAGVVKNLIKVVELQATVDRSKARALAPRDNVVPIFDPEDRNQNIEQWCQRIDELKHLYNWNDESTVYNATSKLDGLASTWYKSLPSIRYSWEEWKELLQKAFPSRSDFYKNILDMVNRTKSHNESYLAYYYEKVALLNKCKIHGEDAVSCLIGGISSSMVQSAARANNYQTQEELLFFLKTCDIDQPSTSRSATSSFAEQRRDRRGIISKTSPTICYKCKKHGHMSKQCKASQCYNCQKFGHRARDCRVPKHPRHQGPKDTASNNQERVL